MQTTRTSPAFEIGPATYAEVPSVVAIHKQTFVETYTGVTPELTNEAVQYHVGGDWATNKEIQFYEKMDTAESELYVARTGGAVVGFCSVRPGWCDGLYVNADYQRKGIGRSLLANTLAHTQDVDKPVGLWVVPGIAAVDFYRHLGFVPNGRDLSAMYPRLRGGEILPQLELSLSGDAYRTLLQTS